uniref:Uncharacterized LOC113144082 n=1 Tax=Mastacembelus armatus TaxID=205130 RepID=A0A7N8XAS9_9TELE
SLLLNTTRCNVFTGCTDDQNFETKTIHVGDDVNLTCPRESSGTLFWIRLVSGNFPKILGKTFDIDTDSRITASEEPRIFVLHITKAELSDTGVYYCLKTQQQTFIFLKGTELRVKEPDITTVSPTDPVHSGDSVTLQCSVFSDSENKTCLEENSLCCYKAGAHQSQINLNCTQENSSAGLGKNPERYFTKKCVCSTFKNISSDTYYCSAATCGEKLFGNRSKLNTDVNTCSSHLQKDNTILFLLCAALAISLIVIAFLLYSIEKLKKKSCGCSNDVVVLQTNATVTGNQESKQTDEESLVYSAPNFRKTSKAERKDAKRSEEESIYTDVRVGGLD